MPKCRVCRDPFDKSKPMQTVCGWECAQEYARTKREQKERRETREKLKALEPLPKLMKRVERAVNAAIRERDKDQPCISCGRFHQGQWHAGHFLSVGSHPELRFNPLNIYKQCQPCNVHLHGNLIEYRKRLIEIKGQELVDWLEGPHQMKQYTREELEGILQKCKKKIYIS